MQKRKNNEARPKFTGSYKKKSMYCNNVSLNQITVDGTNWLYNSANFSVLFVGCGPAQKHKRY